VIYLERARVDDIGFLSKMSHLSEDSTFTDLQLETYLAKGDLFVIFFEREVVGYVAQKIVENEAELLQVMIDPSFQNKGIGRASLLQWHERLKRKNIDRALLEVRVTNLSAIKVYSLLGYKQIGLRKNYYRYRNELVNALVMEATLRTHND